MLKHLLLKSLDEHPDHPCHVLGFRKDVIEQIAASLDGEFPIEEAIVVRPNGEDDRFQIVSGHHRVRAAREAGLKEIPAHVVKLTDEEASMRLITHNAQGEMGPLAIGIHALKRVPRAQGKEGEGVTAYAKTVGKDEKSIRRYRDAAEVVTSGDIAGSKALSLTYHLVEIHRAPREEWKGLCDWLLEQDATVEQIKQRVNQVLAGERWPFAGTWTTSQITEAKAWLASMPRSKELKQRLVEAGVTARHVALMIEATKDRSDKYRKLAVERVLADSPCTGMLYNRLPYIGVAGEVLIWCQERLEELENQKLVKPVIASIKEAMRVLDEERKEEYDSWQSL
jgi:ParB-like nuclease domain